MAKMLLGNTSDNKPIETTVPTIKRIRLDGANAKITVTPDGQCELVYIRDTFDDQRVVLSAKDIKRLYQEVYHV